MSLDIPLDDSADELNPAQRQTLDQLRSTPDECRAFSPTLRDELREELEHNLESIVGGLPEGATLYLSKYPLAQVHGCEARFLANDAEPFAWTVHAARGSVVHKAVELLV